MIDSAMGRVQELFEEPDAERPPPETGRWLHFVAHNRARLEVEFVRRREGLSFGPAQLIVSFPGSQPPLAPDPPVLWDRRVNHWLVEHAAKAKDAANESERFGFALRHEFEVIERDCGSGYFNAIFIAYLQESGLAELPSVERKLAKAHAYRPHVSSASARYLDEVKREVSSAARALRSLGYPQAEAIDILADALAYFLDERFNISTRELLGFG